MKYIFLSILLFSIPCLARDKVIYGKDDRQNISSYPNAEIKEIADSVAALVDPENLTLELNGQFYKLANIKLKDQENFCKETRFLNQLAISDCTGFLVAPDVLLTAGHCMTIYGTCKRFKWIFDYKQKNLVSNSKNLIPAKNVYSCKKILDYTLNTENQNDYAIIKLDRPVKDRSPLRIRRKSSTIEDNSSIFVLGHPSGLPLKVSDNAKVIDNLNPIFFNTNLDTFAGNSGSPVFNQQTLEVEGILVRGEADFVFDDLLGCYKNKVCHKNECSGESVTRITKLKNIYKIIEENL